MAGRLRLVTKRWKGFNMLSDVLKKSLDLFKDLLIDKLYFVDDIMKSILRRSWRLVVSRHMSSSGGIDQQGSSSQGINPDDGSDSLWRRILRTNYVRRDLHVYVSGTV